MLHSLIEHKLMVIEKSKKFYNLIRHFEYILQTQGHYKKEAIDINFKTPVA